MEVNSELAAMFSSAGGFQQNQARLGIYSSLALNTVLQDTTDADILAQYSLNNMCPHHVSSVLVIGTLK